MISILSNCERLQIDLLSRKFLIGLNLNAAYSMFLIIFLHIEIQNANNKQYFKEPKLTQVSKYIYAIKYPIK